MTVAELIDLLRQHPLDARVLVDGHEGGYSEPLVYATEAALDYPHPYGGVHSTLMEAKEGGTHCRSCGIILRDRWGTCYRTAHPEPVENPKPDLTPVVVVARDPLEDPS